VFIFLSTPFILCLQGQLFHWKSAGFNVRPVRVMHVHRCLISQPPLHSLFASAALPLERAGFNVRPVRVMHVHRCLFFSAPPSFSVCKCSSSTGKAQALTCDLCVLCMCTGVYFFQLPLHSLFASAALPLKTAQALTCDLCVLCMCTDVYFSQPPLHSLFASAALQLEKRRL